MGEGCRHPRRRYDRRAAGQRSHGDLVPTSAEEGRDKDEPGCGEGSGGTGDEERIASQGGARQERQHLSLDPGGSFSVDLVVKVGHQQRSSAFRSSRSLGSNHRRYHVDPSRPSQEVVEKLGLQGERGGDPACPRVGGELTGEDVTEVVIKRRRGCRTSQGAPGREQELHLGGVHQPRDRGQGDGRRFGCHPPHGEHDVRAQTGRCGTWAVEADQPV